MSSSQSEAEEPDERLRQRTGMKIIELFVQHVVWSRLELHCSTPSVLVLLATSIQNFKHQQNNAGAVHSIKINIIKIKETY